MNKIEVRVLNPEAILEAEKMAGCAARLTQHGETIENMRDFLDLYERPVSEKFLRNLVALPHPTLQKFSVINIAVVGASRRFLAQITRHQNEVKFMSASLQYSDYSDSSGFVVPYDLLGSEHEQEYLDNCRKQMEHYKHLVSCQYSNDSAGYLAPQGLRNVLIISATPFQWKHMISQRTCRRNTPETRYIMLKIWKMLKEYSPALFDHCGPFCTTGTCKEGSMRCGMAVAGNPEDSLKDDFDKIKEE